MIDPFRVQLSGLGREHQPLFQLLRRLGEPLAWPAGKKLACPTKAGSHGLSLHRRAGGGGGGARPSAVRPEPASLASQLEPGAHLHWESIRLYLSSACYFGALTRVGDLAAIGCSQCGGRTVLMGFFPAFDLNKLPTDRPASR